MLELGDGWAPAVLDNEQEYEFIKVAQRGLSDRSTYWIGGSTDGIRNGINIPLSEYNSVAIGKIKPLTIHHENNINIDSTSDLVQFQMNSDLKYTWFQWITTNRIKVNRKSNCFIYGR